ncbi:diacylglycerol O-acyltransferase 1 isoform X1 [Nematostella vectensis]|uniref:diacylglycerol O-acyltransferase 1 isoform X1 n=1 Tax=Nematostella vectensis TaxID=45351 RepID=UPI0020772347|nr:diacylglycerol O-acyltransferase 1 isoform X1 [Nematostella vectensis]XP_032220232.2 diacylglycerol O-acyltransferase 1 isoform X1 [Nematostella vectensis]
MSSPSNSTLRERVRKPSVKEKCSEAKVKVFDYGKRVHQPEESLFTSTSGFDNYRGILNLCLVLLVLSNFRVALDNILKYGLLIDPVEVATIFLQDPYSWPSASLFVCSNIFIQFAFFVENLLAKRNISEEIGKGLHIFNLMMILVVPIIVILSYKPPPWAAGIVCGAYSMLWLKLISYISVNLWHRNKLIKTSEKENVSNGKNKEPMVEYPDYLTQQDLYYFLLCPTLCYELNFPRLPAIRKRFLIRRIVEFFFLLGLMIGVAQQWIVPTIKNSIKPLQRMEYARAAERVMKLAIPNHFLWLLFFYCYFHSFLNITGELLRFADRCFYKDWWNSNTVQYFWQNWNIPAHRWAVRHLYKPMIRRGYSNFQAQIAVFMLSAFFHEYLVSVPLRMIKLWSFSAMIGQLPMAFFIKRYIHNPNYGNVVVWCSIILGQPLAIMMYFHDYYLSTLETNAQ